MPLIFPRVARPAGNLVRGALHRAGLHSRKLDQGWHSYSGLTDPAKRDAFVHTLRSVIDRTGQTVSAHDRLYLTSNLPTLIVWGQRDRIIPAAHGTAAHKALASSQLVTFERAGHFPHAEEPEQFAEAVVDFIESTKPLHLDEPEWRAAFTAGPPVAS
jgi:pimeloyl-ACP methyl ester carboxylesterase